MTKIRTALAGIWRTTISTGKGAVTFDKEGVAEVSEETAEYLIQTFPNSYYRDGEEKPTPKSGVHIDPSKDPAVLEFARNHSAGKAAEANGAPPTVAVSTEKEKETNGGKLLDEKGDVIETKAADVNKDGVVDEKDLSEVHKEYAKEEKERKELAAEIEEAEKGNTSDEESKSSEEDASDEEEKAELDAETVEMLEKLDVASIHETLVAAGVQDKKTAKIKDKETLIPIAAKKLT